MNVRRARAVAILAAAIACARGGAAAEVRLANLARLAIARVSASGVHGDRPLDDPFYGARNLFDAGANVVNGIGYSSWVSGEPPHWVRVRFQRPVTVQSVAVETGEREPPTTVQIDLRGASGTILRASGLIAIARDRTTYDPPRPVKGVRDVRLAFGGPRQIQVNEVAILGAAPRGTPAREALPAVDLDGASEPGAGHE